MLDRLLREKPNASVITKEAIITDKANKTSKLRKSPSPQKRSLIVKWVGESASNQYQRFKKLRIEIRKAENEKRLNKIEEAEKNKYRNRLIRER